MYKLSGSSHLITAVQMTLILIPYLAINIKHSAGKTQERTKPLHWKI